ncbi:hypothetical protein GCM10009677_56050 [Sphaerisporangium rubeum]
MSALVMAWVFREQAAALPYPVALQLVTDEEVGGRDGTLHQLRNGVIADFVVIGEQSRLQVVTDSKGMVVANLRATGHAAHGAYPWLGDNALLKLMRSVGNVLDRYPVATEEVWRTTVNLARIETPAAARNQVPAAAEAWLDIRFTPQDHDLDGRTTEQVAEYLRGFCEPGVTPVVDHVDPPHHADQHSPDVRALRAAASREGYDAPFLRKHGAADGRFYYERGVDAVIFGIGGDGQHGPQEYADLTTVLPYRRALTAFLRDRRPE